MTFAVTRIESAEEEEADGIIVSVSEIRRGAAGTVRESERGTDIGIEKATTVAAKAVREIREIRCTVAEGTIIGKETGIEIGITTGSEIEEAHRTITENATGLAVGTDATKKSSIDSACASVMTKNDAVEKRTTARAEKMHQSHNRALSEGGIIGILISKSGLITIIMDASEIGKERRPEKKRAWPTA